MPSPCPPESALPPSAGSPAEGDGDRMPGAEQRARAFMRPMGVENADRWASAPGRSIMGAVTEKKITLNHWDAEAFLAIE